MSESAAATAAAASDSDAHDERGDQSTTIGTSAQKAREKEEMRDDSNTGGVSFFFPHVFCTTFNFCFINLLRNFWQFN